MITSAFFNPIKHDIKHFTNILGILEKIEGDQTLERLGNIFTDILNSERHFAETGILNRTAQNQLHLSQHRLRSSVGKQHPHFQGKFKGNLRQFEFIN